jgi:hypothetical protein
LRSGKVGFLYSEDAHEDKEFQLALNRGDPFVEDLTLAGALRTAALDTWVVSGPSLRFTLYAGPWSNDRPHGTGVQSFKDLGAYVGQFEYGFRHGCGTWTSRDGSLRCRPADDQTGDWENDRMHGEVVLEDASGHQERVRYNQGMCQTWRRGWQAVGRLWEAPLSVPSMGFEDPQALRNLARVQRPGRR